MDRIPSTLVVVRKAGRFCLECAAFLIALAVIGTAVIGG